MIILTARLWKALGIDQHVSLQLNSIGSLEARANYRSALVAFLENHQDLMSDEEKERLVKNPLRILDTKNQALQEVLNDAPKLLDYLDEESRTHFATLCQLLDDMGIAYEVNPKLVRGLDYYNKTVFEWVTSALGAQGTVCGGGRYDGLVEQLGGHAAPGVGFAMGLERLVLLVQEVNAAVPVANTVDVYLVYSGEGATLNAFQLAETIRSALPQVRVMTHCSGGKFQKQFKRADKVDAKLALVIGESEVAEKTVVVKDLRSSAEQVTISQADIIETLTKHF